MDPLKRWSHDILQLIRRNQRVFNVCQVGFYGTTLACMALASAYPRLNIMALNQVDKELDAWNLGRMVKEVYGRGDLVGAAGLTFGINLLVGSFLSTTVNAFLPPYGGLAVNLYRAGYWGFLFPPLGRDTTPAHLWTMVMEGQAYILTAFGSCLLSNEMISGIKARWKQWKAKKSKGAGENVPLVLGQGPLAQEDPWGGLKKSMMDNLKLYIPIAAILALSAVWEAYEVIYLPLKKH